MNTEVKAPPMLSSEQLAGKVLYKLYDELAETQDRIIKLEARQARFGDMAMPLHVATRDTLARSPEFIKRELVYWHERSGEMIETIRVLEAVFKDKEDADMEAFAEYIKAKFRKEK